MESWREKFAVWNRQEFIFNLLLTRFQSETSPSRTLVYNNTFVRKGSHYLTKGKSPKT